VLLVIAPQRLARFLTILVVTIGVIGTGAQFVQQASRSWSYGRVSTVAGKFVLDSELTFPAWYSSVAILACSALLALIALAKRRTQSLFARHWTGLAVILLLMSIDEMIAVHEMLIGPLRRFFGASGILHYTWVVPAFFFVCIFALTYVRFVFVHLDARTRRRFIAAGLIYVGAALGMELVEGPIDQRFGAKSLLGVAAVSVEETSEMLGIVLFFVALLRYAAEHVGVIRVRIEDPHAENPQTNRCSIGPCS